MDCLRYFYSGVTSEKKDLSVSSNLGKYTLVINHNVSRSWSSPQLPHNSQLFCFNLIRNNLLAKLPRYNLQIPCTLEFFTWVVLLYMKKSLFLKCYLCPWWLSHHDTKILDHTLTLPFTNSTKMCLYLATGLCSLSTTTHPSQLYLKSMV